MAGSDSKTQSLRPLLPQPNSVRRDPTPSQTKKPRIKQACEACRQSKSKCSGDLPKCRVCVDKGLKCRYVATPAKTRLHDLQRRCNDLQSKSSPYEELFRLLKTVKEQEAMDILARVRSGTEVETLLSQLTDGDLLLQLSVVPDIRYRYDFPYIVKMPENLLTEDNLYLQSVIHDATAIYTSRTPPGARREGSRPPNISLKLATMSQSSAGRYSTDEAAYLNPFHAAEVIDLRISQAEISNWTLVCNDDVLMRNLLRKWFHCKYQLTAIFQKDLFLEDLVSHGKDFCSSLLVNIILGYACVCYAPFKDRAEYWNPHSLTYRFLAEAKRLWELEAHEPHLTTIQAGMLFNVFYNLSGLDEVGQTYRIQSIDLAHRMRLFDNSIDITSPRIRLGMAFTAWAVFNWESLVAFSFMFAPLLSKPPDWSLPDPSTNGGWYGEIWTKYPSSKHSHSSNFGHLFRARSRFRIIMNKACQVAWSNDSEMSLDKANELFSQLRVWFDALPGPLHPQAIVLPGQLQLHIYYHHLVITMFNPVLDVNTNQVPSPRQIVEESTKYLHTLIRLYYLRHGFESMDLFIVIPLMLAATDCIDAINGQASHADLETLRSTLILATKALFLQRRNHDLARTLFQVIRGRMRPAGVSLFRNVMNMNAEQMDEEPDMVQMVRNHCPISVVQKKEDIRAYT